MRAIAVTQPGQVEVIELDAPVPGPYQAVVQTDLAALCNSTDGKLVKGTFPGMDQYPLVLGHESTGIVTAVGEKVRNFAVGDRVIGGLLFEFSPVRYASGWGGFCEFTLANDHDAMVADSVADGEHGWFECYEIQRRVDRDIPAAEAVLMCTWREVLGGFGDFQLQPGDDLLIYGAGPVGLSFVKFARLLNLGWVGVVDPLPHKRDRARSLGADATFSPDNTELATYMQQRGRPLDAVVDAVGSEAVINAALPLIRLGGTIGVYGVLSSPTLTINKGAGPYNFNLLMHQWPTRWREREAQTQLGQWIRDGQLQASQFVTHEFPIERIGEALQTVRDGAAVKCLLRF